MTSSNARMSLPITTNLTWDNDAQIPKINRNQEVRRIDNAKYSGSHSGSPHSQFPSIVICEDRDSSDFRVWENFDSIAVLFWTGPFTQLEHN